MASLSPSWLVRRPSPVLGWSVAALLTALWGTLRLVVFHSMVFPLTYALPLLASVWTRNIRMLWAMAGVFAVLHTIKQWWILPAGALPRLVDWATYAATLVNIGVAALVVHAIVLLRARLERSLEQVRAQADELERQNEELAQQSEELAVQAEELSQQVEEISQQSEELSAQNAELQAQTEEIQALNTDLGQREALLQRLFDAARLAGTQSAAAQHVCEAAIGMLGAPVTAVAIHEQSEQELLLRGVAGVDDTAVGRLRHGVPPQLITLLMEQDRTASVNDASLRPDLALVDEDGTPVFNSLLGAPLRRDGVPAGAVTFYSRVQHEWTAHQFRVAEWIAAQAAHILQILRLQEALTRANADLAVADRRKSEFLATLSHELRNPLVPIRFALELLNIDGNTPAARAKQIIERQLCHLVRLIDDLLDVTRIASNKVRLRTQRITLASVVEHAMEANAREIADAGHHVTVSLPQDEVWLEADAVRLAQVLTNLLKNAVRYTPGGGRISVSAALEQDDVTIAVGDNGIGLTADDVTRIFDMFAQVGEPGHGGLGIGLALVKGLVELHGGSVVARSAGLGLGSEFIVRLPAAAAPVAGAQPELAAASENPLPPASQRILVVDDNADSAEMLRTFLQMQGHEVHVAYDGLSALAAATRVRPQVGVFDIGLPGIDGYELARRLRFDPTQERLFLIALTGWGQEGDRHRAQAAGFDAHLTKPADPEAISKLVLRAAKRAQLS